MDDPTRKPTPDTNTPQGSGPPEDTSQSAAPSPLYSPVEDDPRLRIPEVLRERPGGSLPTARRGSPGADQTRKTFSETAKAWGMALDLVFTTIGGLILGSLFDWWQGTAPYGAITGLGIGFVAAFIRLIRLSLRAEAKDKDRRDEARNQRRQ